MISGFGTLKNSQFKSFYTSEDHVAVKNTRVGSEGIGCKVNLLSIFLIFEDKSPHGEIGMAIDVFRETVIGNISSEEDG